TIDRTGDVAPIAQTETVSVAEGGTATVVLAATDTQHNPLTYSIVTPPADGTLSAITNGNTLTYSPVAGFFGSDSFTFQATDPDGKESQAAVSVTVTPVNQPPVAIAQSLNVNHDAPQVIILGGTDAETPASQLTYKITTQPAHGTLTQNAGSPNAFTYTPGAGYLGLDSFAFTVTDTGNPPGTTGNAKTSGPATVSLDVVDPAPVGVPDSYTTREGVPLSVTAAQGVLANDTDSAGDALTATVVTPAAHGTLVLNSNGSFTYTPTAGFTGTDSFTYLPHGTYVAGSATTVTINVTAGVAPPPPPPPPHHNASAALVVESASSPGPLVLSAAALPAASPAAVPATATPAQPATATPARAATAIPARPTATAPSHRLPAAVPVASATPAPASAWLKAAAPGIALPVAPTPAAPMLVITSALPFWLDASGLMAVNDPILLPSYTLAGDETASLMLPASPEISSLPEAFSAAARRLMERQSAIITFVDPTTGAPQENLSPTSPPATDLTWLLVDADPDNAIAAQSSRLDSPRIDWGSVST
ncbi:MAG TPA: Ig-like domain-containing protein, partial [Acetobacteraceae bacterium]